jgi:hypothetical protein
MGFIIIIPFGWLAGWSIFAIARWLRQGGYGREWWKVFAILGTGGFLLGIWLAFFMQYRVGNVHLEGFPIPAGISSREKPDAPWVKSDMPVAVSIGSMITDLLCGVAACLAPIPAGLFFKENRTQPPWSQPRPTPPP